MTQNSFHRNEFSLTRLRRELPPGGSLIAFICATHYPYKLQFDISAEQLHFVYNNRLLALLSRLFHSIFIDLRKTFEGQYGIIAEITVQISKQRLAILARREQNRVRAF